MKRNPPSLIRRGAGVAFFLAFANLGALILLSAEAALPPGQLLPVLLLGGAEAGALLYAFFRIARPYRLFNRRLGAYNAGYHSDLKSLQGPAPSEELRRFFRKIARDLRTEGAIRSSNKDAEYLALQNQINPHFLYNTLEGIRSDALAEGVDNIAQIVESLAVFFRYTISQVDRLVSLEEELTILRTYLDIQNYRFGDRIRMEEILDGCDRSIREVPIPKLILQPFIENAILHGLEEKVGVGTIKIFISATKELLLLTIEDDGRGIAEEELNRINAGLSRVSPPPGSEEGRKRGGIAINNVNNRIKLLFGEKYGVKLRSIPGHGTAVDLVLPREISGAEA